MNGCNCASIKAYLLKQWAQLNWQVVICWPLLEGLNVISQQNYWTVKDSKEVSPANSRHVIEPYQCSGWHLEEPLGLLFEIQYQSFIQPYLLRGIRRENTNTTNHGGQVGPIDLETPNSAPGNSWQEKEVGSWPGCEANLGYNEIGKQGYRLP